MNQRERIEIDLADMCKYLLSKWIIFLAVIIICAGIATGLSKVKNQVYYMARTELYITVSKQSNKSMNYDDANELVQDYMELIPSDLVLRKASEETKLSLSEIRNSLSVSRVPERRFLIITINHSNKTECSRILKAVLRATKDTIVKDLKKDEPIKVEKPSDPVKTNTVNLKKNILLGTMFGFVLSITGLFVKFIQIQKRKSI